MTGNSEQIVMTLFGTRNLKEVSIEQLKELVETYPSFNVGHYLLSKRLETDKNSESLNANLKTALYFNNPFWLQWLLENQKDESTGSEEKADGYMIENREAFLFDYTNPRQSNNWESPSPLYNAEPKLSGPTLEPEQEKDAEKWFEAPVDPTTPPDEIEFKGQPETLVASNIPSDNLIQKTEAMNSNELELSTPPNPDIQLLNEDTWEPPHIPMEDDSSDKPWTEKTSVPDSELSSPYHENPETTSSHQQIYPSERTQSDGDSHLIEETPNFKDEQPVTADFTESETIEMKGPELSAVWREDTGQLENTQELTEIPDKETAPVKPESEFIKAAMLWENKPYSLSEEKPVVSDDATLSELQWQDALTQLRVLEEKAAASQPHVPPLQAQTESIGPHYPETAEPVDIIDQSFHTERHVTDPEKTDTEAEPNNPIIFSKEEEINEGANPITFLQFEAGNPSDQPAEVAGLFQTDEEKPPLPQEHTFADTPASDFSDENTNPISIRHMEEFIVDPSAPEAETKAAVPVEFLPFTATPPLAEPEETPASIENNQVEIPGENIPHPESSLNLDPVIATENHQPPTPGIQNLPLETEIPAPLSLKEEVKPVLAPEDKKPVITNDEPPLFDPYHTIDYFASQGIKFVYQENPNDKFGKQLKSFTDWLKIMKRLPQKQVQAAIEQNMDSSTIETFAATSLVEKDTLTETMAAVLAKQGKNDKAIEIYQKLSLLNPSKNAYFAARIEELKTY